MIFDVDLPRTVGVRRAPQLDAAAEAHMSERGCIARFCAPCRVEREAQGTDAASSHRRATSANGFGDFCQDKSHPPKAEAFDVVVDVDVDVEA